MPSAKTLFADLEPSGALQCELVDEIAKLSGGCDGFPCWKQTCSNRLTITVPTILRTPER